MTKKELIEFLDGLVELASEENKEKAVLVKEKFINGFEKNYEYEQEVQKESPFLPSYYIVSDGKLRETQTANYFSDIYPIDCAVLSANAQSCQKCCTLLSVLFCA